MRLFVCDDKVITLWTCNGPPVPWPVGRAVLGALEAPVLMVGTDPVVVEERLRSGMLRCPGVGTAGSRPGGMPGRGRYGTVMDGSRRCDHSGAGAVRAAARTCCCR